MERVLKKRTGNKTPRENLLIQTVFQNAIAVGKARYYSSLSSGSGSGKNEKETTDQGRISRIQ